MLTDMDVGGKDGKRNPDLGNDGVTTLVDHGRALRAREVMRPVSRSSSPSAVRTLGERASGRPGRHTPDEPLQGDNPLET